MAYMKMLPTTLGTKLIIIDEATDAMYARTLIAGWIHIWKQEGEHNKYINLYSFSQLSSHYKYESTLFQSKNIRIYDYYTTDVLNEIHSIDSLFKQIFQDIFNFAILQDKNQQNIIIIDCLSTLILNVGLLRTIKFIEKLNRELKELQIICIYRRDFLQTEIPDIESFGTTYIKLEKFTGIIPIHNLTITYTAKLIHKKLSGSVIYQTELIKQDINSYEINAEKIMEPKLTKASTNKPAKIESSFKIEMNAREMEQRDKTPLPHTLNIPNTSNTSKIFYEPDDADDINDIIDDIDEEDPDDDLLNL